MRVLAGILIVIGFVVAVVIGAMNELRTSCEVCMFYAGREVCESAAAADRDMAVSQATGSACARLSNGVTDGIRCGNTPPRSVECNE